MYDGNLKEQARKEKEALELQINQLITDYETRWKAHWTQLLLHAIPETKNNLSYNRQKWGRIQLYLIFDV